MRHKHAAPKHVEPKSGWRNWGDHPFVVLISVIASLVTIGVILADKILSSSSPPDLKVGSTWISPKDGMKMVYVPKGEFTMGSGSEAHKVTLDSYWIDQTEVTSAMYVKCVSEGGCIEPTNTGSYSHSSYYGNLEFDNYPMIHVDWNMASAYCKWADRQLPTEAQWEKAARGTDGRMYPWGEGIDCQKANYNITCVEDTSPVGSYQAGKSPYGALDMAGNVWEWVNDWYSDTYYQSSPLSNPLGPASGQFRALRGGSWYDLDYGLGSADRSRYDPSYSGNGIGFRCARSQP